MSTYRLVVVPNLCLVDDTGADNFTAHVRAGGHLLMSYFSGIVDAYDRVRPGGHPCAFRDLLGIEIDEFAPLRPGETVGLHHVGHTGTATDWQDVIDLAGAELLAAYTDGELKGGPAVTRHRFGTGTATYSRYLTRPRDPAPPGPGLRHRRRSDARPGHPRGCRSGPPPSRRRHRTPLPAQPHPR
ncbi:beta-galactosidase trimerization domain-containing protein [Streptomyces sp. ME19-01-6]|nr:beta-galactosidase trimerization domain-containing protein [Streptomyces sp. ME19-01-6]MDX3226709.1 beta-galactosidase trimerization domain-containing protein [Streptomyces sp. ME19-01-6]